MGERKETEVVDFGGLFRGEDGALLGRVEMADGERMVVEPAGAGEGAMSRRHVLFGCAAAAAGAVAASLARPAEALAECPAWNDSTEFAGGWCNWNNGDPYPLDFGSLGDVSGDYGTLSKGYSGYARTPWMRWEMWSDNWLGTGLKLLVECDFTNKLFCHCRVTPQAAGMSQVGNRDWGWVRTAGDDSYYELQLSWDKGGSASKLSSMVFDLDTSASSPKTVHRDASGIWHTWFETWGGSWDVFWRRGTAVREPWLKLYGKWWMFYYFGRGAQYNPQSAIGRTRWIANRVPARTIGTGIEWCGRVLRFRSAASDGAGQYLYSGNNRDLLTNGTGVGMWSGGAAWNRMWFLSPVTTGTRDAGAWSNANPWKGSLKMKNMFNVKTTGGWLNASGGGPSSANGIDAQSWDYDGTAASCVWVFSSGGNQFVATDCAGHLLNRKEGSSANGKAVWFYSCGNDANELSDNNAKWKIEEATYSLRSGASLSLAGLTGGKAFAGQKVTCAVPRSATYPDDSSRSYASYDVKWVSLDASDSGAWLKDRVTVYARCYTTLGQFGVEMPCDNYAGTFGLTDVAMNAVHLRVPYTTLSGSIEYRFRKLNGSWEAWRAGSKGDNGTGSDAWAGSKSASYYVDQFQCRLTGDLAKKYDVLYFVGYSSGSTTGWKSNGATAGAGGDKICCIGARLIPKSLATGQSYTPTTAIAGKKLAAWTRCFVSGADSGLGTPGNQVWILGSVASAAVNVQGYVKVHYVADGTEMFVQPNVPALAAFTPSADGLAACKRAGCDGITGFYSDAACANAWAAGTKTGTSDLYLYCRNKVTLKYGGATDEASAYFDAHAPSKSESLSPAWDWKTDFKKARTGSQLYYGDTVRPDDFTDLPAKAWVDHEGLRSCGRVGPFGSRAAKSTDAPRESWKLAATTTVWYGYGLPAFDGYRAS